MVARGLSRRLFLRGLGGACVAAPFLGSVVSRSVKAQSALAPRRLIVMFTHNGCITTRFFPTKSHGALTADDLEPTTLKHLVPHVDKLLMPRGIRAMNEWTYDMVRGQGNDVHTQVVGSYFTCQPVTPNSNNPFDFDQAKKFNAMPVGPSLDHVIAQQLSMAGTPFVLRVANQTDTPQSGISYSAAETPFSGYGTPLQAYSTLTGLLGSGPMSPDTYRTLRGKSALDIFADDLDTLERFDMSQSDRNKLEAWKTLLHETTRSMVAAKCDQSVAALLGASSDNVNQASMRPTSSDLLTQPITSDMDVADICAAVAVLTAVCNTNPVMVLKYPNSYVFSGLGLHTESESMSGRLDNAGMSGTCMPGVVDMLITLDDYYARKFARLAGLLESIEENDGTVLDNTAAIWFNEMSDGCAGNLNNLPIVQVGSCGGYFKTGWAVNVEDGSPTLTTGNSEAVCTDGTSNQVNGISQNTGTDPKLANAPINKYYCNLMNALGVRAGADGFPARGGTQDVTHFGMYDKTEDFIGGGTNPPTIHDPGEYTALKANV